MAAPTPTISTEKSQASSAAFRKEVQCKGGDGENKDQEGERHENKKGGRGCCADDEASLLGELRKLKAGVAPGVILIQAFPGRRIRLRHHDGGIVARGDTVAAKHLDDEQRG